MLSLSDLPKVWEYVNQNPDKAECLAWARLQPYGPASDIFGKLAKYGTMSDAQARYVAMLWDNTKVKMSDTPCPNGRRTFRGTVISTKEVDDHFDYYGGKILKLTFRPKAATGCTERAQAARRARNSATPWRSRRRLSRARKTTASGSTQDRKASLSPRR